jgi:hypothetical protein
MHALTALVGILSQRVWRALALAASDAPVHGRCAAMHPCVLLPIASRAPVCSLAHVFSCPQQAVCWALGAWRALYLAVQRGGLSAARAAARGGAMPATLKKLNT